jgi:hypothetical protein
MTLLSSPKPKAVPKSHGCTTSGPHLLSAPYLLLTNPTSSLVSRIVKHARVGYTTSPQRLQGA